MTTEARREPRKGRKMAVKPKVQKALEEGSTEDLFLNLTPRQTAFANEYIKDFNGQAAAQRAGYTGNFLNRQAHQLLTNPGVKKAIDILLSERAGTLDVDIGYVIRKLTRTLERCEDQENFNPNAVLRAAELLGKYLGMFIERQEISGKDGAPIQYEKVQEDADAFTRSIASLRNRGGNPDVPLKLVGGTEG